MAEPMKETMNDRAFEEPETELPLTREEGFALLESMKGMWSGQLERYGGVEEFIRKLRSEEEDLVL